MKSTNSEAPPFFWKYHSNASRTIVAKPWSRGGVIPHVSRVREDPWIIRRLSSRLDPGLRDVWQRKLTVTGRQRENSRLSTSPQRDEPAC